MNFKTILSVETSCDDTSVAIVNADGFVLKQVSASQDLQHTPYGGVVPEIASRNHSISLLPLIDECLNKANLKISDIDGFAVTNRPGLIGSLIVGVMTVKALAQSFSKPFIGVNHLEGHLLAPFLKDTQYSPPAEFTYPYVALAVSGGHTSIYWVEDFGKYQIIGTTKDDAAGEAFDKFAKMVGLGYPGGVLVDRESIGGDDQKYSFPKSLLNDGTLMMSFSGLKSAAHRLITQLGPEVVAQERKNLCASFQSAVVDVLISKCVEAAQKYQTRKIAVTGGVSANSYLRKKTENLINKGYSIVIPPLRYCTDNAAMIGYVGIQKLNLGFHDGLDLGPFSSSQEGDFIKLMTPELRQPRSLK